VRLLVSNVMTMGNDVSWEEPLEEIQLGVDIDKLVESVFVSPEAPKWLTKSVMGVLKAFGYENTPVVTSDRYDARVQ
jgi:hypothetical protein